MKHFSIRTAHGADLPELYKIEAETFSGKHAYSYTALRQLFDISGRLCLIAESSDLLGYTLGVMHSIEKLGWILSLVVRPTARRQGIGKALTHELTGRLAEQGARLIQLTVEGNNQSAIQLYECLGFKKKSFERNYFGPDEDRIIMTLSSEDWGKD